MNRFGWVLVVVAAFTTFAAPVAMAGPVKAIIAQHYAKHESLCAKLKHKHAVAGPNPIKQHLHHGGKGGGNCPNCQ